ncbi:MAG TPA: O-antigen ligase family protein [Clostridia bacterium]
MAEVTKKMKKNNRNEIDFLARIEAAKPLRVILLIALLVLIFYPPFLRGLFFETEQLPAEIFTFSIFIVFWIYKYITRDNSFLRTHLDYAAFGFMFVYFLSTVFAAVSTRSAISEWLKYCMFFAVFFMISELTKSKMEKLLVLWTIVASGVGVCLVGIDGAAGSSISNFINTAFPKEKPLFFDLFRDGRIYSTLQYPNALAVYLIAIFFIALALTITTDKLWTRITGISAAYILGLTFLLTQSRGAFLLIPFVVILYIIVMPKGSRIKASFYMVVAFVPAIGCGYLINSYVSQQNAGGLKVWMLSAAGIICSVVLLLFVTFILSWLENISWKVYAVVLSVAVIICSSIGAFVLNAEKPLILDNTASSKEIYLVRTRYSQLEAGKEYKLVFDINASAKKEMPYAYFVQVANLTEKNILFGGQNYLKTKYEPSTNGNVEREVTFKVPKDTKTLYFDFINNYPGTKAIFSNARIIDMSTGKMVKKLILDYKYIPENIANRFNTVGIDQSSIQREYYNKDALKMFEKNWFLGTGGGSWPLIYFSNQSFFYTSTQTHNYIMQIAIESGIVGLVLLALFVIVLMLFVLYRFKNKHNLIDTDGIIAVSAFVGVVALVAHSFMDFDLSLSSVFLLLWELAAILNAVVWRNGISKESVETSSKGILAPLGVMKKLPPFIGAAFFLVLLVMTSSLNIAAGNSEKSKSELANNNIDSGTEFMKSAVSEDGFNPSYKIDYATLLVRKNGVTTKDLDEADKYISHAENQAAYDSVLISRIGDYYAFTKRTDKALSFYDRMTKLKPFGLDAWQKKVESYAGIVIGFFNDKDNNNAVKYLDKMLKLPDEAQSVNKGNMNPFIFNAKTMQILEKFKYIKDYIHEIKAVSIDKVIFYSMNDLDVDNDGVCDQWSSEIEGKMKISSEDGLLVVGSSDGRPWNIKSRDISLSPSKRYMINVEMQGVSDIKTLPYSMTGIGNGQMTQDGNAFYTTVNTPADFNQQTSNLLLQFDKVQKIKKVTITEAQ